MKYFVGFAGLLLMMLACQPKGNSVSQADTDALAYDSVMAVELGADEYGMSAYVMAFLKRGPNAPRDSAHGAELQRAHLDNIRRMAEEGKLVLAGPFMDRGEVRGIYIFDVPSVEEAKKLTNTDPAIRYGSLIMELKPWYGSAALKKVNDLHAKIAKINP